MAPYNSNKSNASLINKVIELENRIKMLERFMNLDDETISRAMKEKEEFTILKNEVIN
jgi:hypothetical protein